MKAVYKANREKGIKIVDLPIPKISAANEVLVKVKKAAICGTDIHLYDWNQWCENVNAKNPMIIGHEFCGEVVEIGSNATLIKVGDLIDVVFEIGVNEWNGNRELQLKIVDLKKSE